MKRLSYAAIIVSAFIIGCATAATVGSVLAEGPLPSAAHPRPVIAAPAHECFGVTTWVLPSRDLSESEPPQRSRGAVYVPEGWKIVGGGLGQDERTALMIVCRPA